MKKLFVSIIVVVMLLTSVLALSACTESGTDWEIIKKRGELKIGYTLFAPIAYKDVDGSFKGFDIELAKAVSEILGVRCKFIEINWDTKEMALATKDIDLVWNGLTIDDKRKETMAISIPYLTNSQVAIIRAKDKDKYTSLDSIRNQRLIAESGSAGLTAIANHRLVDANNTIQGNPRSAEKQTDVLTEIKTKASDVGILDSTLADYYITTPGFNDLMVIPNLVLANEEYGIAGRKGALTTIWNINNALIALAKNGTLASIAAAYGLTSRLAVDTTLDIGTEPIADVVA